MAIPRPLLLALIGAVLVGGAFFASRGGTSEEPASTPVAPAPEPGTATPEPTSKAPATTSARQALSGAAVVTSGEFALHVSAKRLDLSAKGSFQSQGLSKMPLFEVELSGESGGKTLQAGAVSMGDTAYLIRGNQALVLQPQGWEALTGARAQQAEKGPGGEKFNGYSKKELGSFELQGRGTLDGAPVLHFRGAVERKEARDDFGDIGELFKSTSLDSPLPGVLERSIRGGTIDFWVGADDHILRRELYRYNSAAGPVEIDYRRAEVNQSQTISAPADPLRKTPVEAGWDRESFGLGLTALTVGVLAVEPGGGRSANQERPARDQARAAPEPSRKPARKTQPASRRSGTSPAEVKRAIGRHQIVLLFFRQRGADDDAVARSVNSERGRQGVSVFTLPVGQAPKYGKVGGANVTRAPSIVLIGRDGEPRLFEGFIDAATLAQAVTDLR